MDSTKNEINSNPYLIVDGDEGVLIDPGSPLDFEAVLTMFVVVNIGTMFQSM